MRQGVRERPALRAGPSWAYGGRVTRRLVLVHPAGARNVGTALRVAANFGPCELALVAKPTHQLLTHPDFAQMAHGVEDAQSRVRRFDTLAEALADCTWAVGFTARLRRQRQVHDWRDLRDEVARRARLEGERVALVLGSERYGLQQAETALVQRLARIPVAEEHESLNLGVAAALVLYDTFVPDAPPAGADRTTPVSAAERAFLAARVSETLGAIAEYDALRDDVQRSVERIFNRAALERRDARVWHSLMRRLGNAKGPDDYPPPA